MYFQSAKSWCFMNLFCSTILQLFFQIFFFSHQNYSFVWDLIQKIRSGPHFPAFSPKTKKHGPEKLWILPANCLSVFDHFVRLALKVLSEFDYFLSIIRKAKRFLMISRGNRSWLIPVNLKLRPKQQI